MDANSNLRQTHHLQQSVNGVGRKSFYILTKIF